jgi:hypothetical protein
MLAFSLIVLGVNKFLPLPFWLLYRAFHCPRSLCQLLAASLGRSSARTLRSRNSLWKGKDAYSS